MMIWKLVKTVLQPNKVRKNYWKFLQSKY